MLIIQASDMHASDRALFLWINLDPHSPASLVSLAVLVSRWLPAVGVAGLVLALLLGPRRWRRAVLSTAAAMALAWLGASLIKQGVTSPRPFALGLGTDWLGHSSSNGFPSSHASVATAFAVSALLSGWAPAARWALALAGLLVCWSRIAVGVHFPSDVMAAMLLGTFCAVAVQGTARWLSARRSGDRRSLGRVA